MLQERNEGPTQDSGRVVLRAWGELSLRNNPSPRKLPSLVCLRSRPPSRTTASPNFRDRTLATSPEFGPSGHKGQEMFCFFCIPKRRTKPSPARRERAPAFPAKPPPRSEMSQPSPRPLANPTPSTPEQVCGASPPLQYLQRPPRNARVGEEDRSTPCCVARGSSRRYQGLVEPTLEL